MSKISLSLFPTIDSDPDENGVDGVINMNEGSITVKKGDLLVL